MNRLLCRLFSFFVPRLMISMGGGGGGGSSGGTNVTINKPWSGAAQYLTGNDKKGITGIFPSAEKFFNQYSALTPQQQGLNDSYYNTLAGRSSGFDAIANAGANMLGGAYNSNYQLGAAPVAGTQSAGTYTGNFQNALKGLGDLNTTNAYKKLLSGQLDNPYLDDMHRAYINDSLRGYNDALTDFSRTVLPGVGSDAFAAGQYGSSRQGIAEGMAMDQVLRNARDLGIAAMDSGAQLYGNAYENAQGRMQGAADYLTSQATGMEQFNKSQQQSASQFNAAQSNAQALANAQMQQAQDQFAAQLDLQQKQFGLDAALKGINTLSTGWGLADNTYNQQQAILNQPMLQAQNALNQYANIVSPGAGMGGSSSSYSSIPVYNSGAGQAIGGGLSIAGLLGSLISGSSG